MQVPTPPSCRPGLGPEMGPGHPRAMSFLVLRTLRRGLPASVTVGPQTRFRSLVQQEKGVGSVCAFCQGICLSESFDSSSCLTRTHVGPCGMKEPVSPCSLTRLPQLWGRGQSPRHPHSQTWGLFPVPARSLAPTQGPSRASSTPLPGKSSQWRPRAHGGEALSTDFCLSIASCRQAPRLSQSPAAPFAPSSMLFIINRSWFGLNP